MSLPSFGPGADPGPSFADLLRVTRAASSASDGMASASLAVGATGGPAATGAEIPHGTTCVAIRYDGGVVLAGDRRATAGHLISNHRIEKVFSADRHSGIAIAGAAGPSAEMVRLFQLQLEHYEKVEGTPISLEGKANQLGQMVRANLPAAMQGLVVIPILAGYDLAGGRGRIFEYDVTGGRYEERDYASTGSGSLHADTVVKLGFRPSLGRGPAVDLALDALFVASDADAGTGGPDPVRDVFPVVAVIDEGGYLRLEDSDLRKRTERLLRRHRTRRSGGDTTG